MKYSLNKLNNIKLCPFKGYMNKFNYKVESNKILQLNALMKKAIKNQINNDLLSEYFDENIDKSIYLLDKELLYDKNIFIKYLTRFNNYINKNSLRIIETNYQKDIKINGKIITVKGDIITKDIVGNYTIIKLFSSQPSLNNKARNEENLPSNDYGLYLLKLLGDKYLKEHEIKNKYCNSAYFHLKGKYDEKEYYNIFLSENGENRIKDLFFSTQNQILRLESEEAKKKEINKFKTVLKKVGGVMNFEGSKESHIIKTDYYNIDYILNELNTLLNIDLNINSETVTNNTCEYCSYKAICNKKNFNKIELELFESNNKNENKKELKLTNGQKQFIEFNNGYARVNATAGSGKTFTTILRTAELLKTYTPKDILLITFTNSGANEMRNKISKFTKYNPKDLNIFTFNGFGMSIIEKYYDKLGYTESPKIITSIDKVSLIKSILNKHDKIEGLNYQYPLLNFPNSKGCMISIINIFNNIRDNKKEFNLENQFEEKDIILINKIYNEYNQELIKNNLIEYSDQINYAIKLFKENKDLIKEYSFAHITLDEMQDTNEKQIELLKILESNPKFKSFCGVGDDAQSIYGFRDCSPEFIINYEKNFPNFKDINLLENFRSTKSICNLSNKIIKLNKTRIDKSMTPNKDINGLTKLYEIDTMENEYNKISKSIQSLIDIGEYPTDICILTRTMNELIEIQKVLNRDNIPNNISVTQTFRNNHNIQLIINLGKFISNTNYNYYLLEFLLSKYNLNDILSDEDSKNLIKQVDLITEKVNKLHEIKDNNIKNNELFYLYIDMIDELLENDVIATEFIDNTLELRQWHSFNKYINYINKFIKYKDESRAKPDKEKYNAVTLSTAHSSKGLEWDNVFVMLDKFKYNEKEIDDLEEERRLLFVTCTRAKENLFLYYNTNQDKKRNKGKYVEFANEIKNILEEVTVI